MALPIAAMALGGAALGGLSGALGGGSKKGEDASNIYMTELNNPHLKGMAKHDFQNRIQEILGNPATEAGATGKVQNNAILGDLFGQSGALSRANDEEQSLSKAGFGLTNQDHEAYGQASGNIARMFGENEQSLAQALSARGLDSSGVAGQAFSNSLGNKNEQLAGLQTSIAQKRMEMNQQRLNSTRNFMTQLGSQANTAINDQYGRDQETRKTNWDENMGWLDRIQGTNNSNAGLRNGGSAGGQSPILSGINGAIGGAMAGASLGNAMGGMSGGSTPKPGQESMFAGQSHINRGNVS